MYEQLLILIRYVRKIWLHRRIALSVAVGGSLVGWVVVLSLPDVYEASTRVYVDPNSMMGKVLEGLAPDTSAMQFEFLRAARTTLTSRPNLERVARETDLGIRAKTPADVDHLLTSIENAITLQSAGTTGRRNEENLFSISYTDNDPQVALAVVRSLLGIFMDTVLGFQQTNTLSTEDFLDSQISEYRKRVDESEARLKQFRRAHITELPRQGGGYFASYQEAAENVQQTETRLRSLKRQYAAIQQRLSALQNQSKRQSSQAIAGSGSDPQQQIRKLQEQLAALRTRYTDQHPDVQALIEQLRSLNQPLAAPSDGAATDTADVDPVVKAFTASRLRDDLTVELTKVASEIAATEAELEEYRDQMQQMLSALEGLPEVEAELARLTRDFEMNQRQYEVFLERRESAQVSRDAARSSDEDVFRIVDPPHVGSKPTGPNRALLLSLVFVIATGAGAGVALALSLVQDSYSDSRELEERTGVRVLGRVGLVRTPQEILAHQRSYVVYAATLSVLLGVYVYLLLGIGFNALPIPHFLRLWTVL